MKLTTIILLLMLPIWTSAQYKSKYKYREPPETGEVVILAGLALVAVTATGLMHNERVNPGISKAIGVVGGGFICAGVAIDLNGKGRNHKGKKRRARWRF